MQYCWWSVIPLDRNRNGKKPFLRWKEHQTEPASEEQVALWHARHPDALWAVVTGQVSDLVVLDFDGPEGMDTIAHLGLEAHVETPSGGAHVHVQRVPFAVQTGARVDQASFPGVDVRGEGGYAAFYGQSANGEYRWNQRDPYDFETLPESVQDLLRSLRKDKQEQNSSESLRATPAPSDSVAEKLLSMATARVGDSGRNETGLWLARQLWDHGFSEDVGWDWMQQYVEAVPSRTHPYTETEALATWKQVTKTERREPFLIDLPEVDDVLREVRAALGEYEAADHAADYCDDLLTEDQVMDLPPLEWLVERFFVAQGVVVVYGEPGIGKTLELLNLAQMVGRGEEWYGNDTQHGGVLFVEGEVVEFRERLEAHRAYYGDPEKPVPVSYLPATLDLTVPQSVAAVVRTVQAMEARGGKVRLVVIEPLIEHFSGDENGEGMELATRALRVIAKLCQCCVVTGHHTNASGERARGNDKLRARVHAMFRMERFGSEVGLVCEKQRSGEWLALRLLMTPQADSVVLSYIESSTAAEYARAKKRREKELNENAKTMKKDVQASQAREILVATVGDNPGIGQGTLMKKATGQGVGKSVLEKAYGDLKAEADPPLRIEKEANNKHGHYLREEGSQ